MQLSRGARRSVPEKLFAFLTGTWCEGYSRARAAAACECSERTIDRALGCLVAIAAIARHRGGRATSAKISVIIDMDEFLQRFATVAHYMAHGGALNVQGGAPSGAYNLRKKYKERKPPLMERTQNHRFEEQTDEAYRAGRFSAWRGLSVEQIGQARRMAASA